MSEGSRGNGHSVRLAGLLAAIGFVVCGLGGGILYGLCKQVTYDQEAQDHIADYAEYTRNEVSDACVGVAPVDQSYAKIRQRTAPASSNENMSVTNKISWRRNGWPSGPL